MNHVPTWRAALLFGLAASSNAHAEDATLCTAGEIRVFSCILKNAIIVSICASPDAARRYVDYRFGSPSKMELAYSASATLPGHRFHHGEVVYANNSEDTLWFTNGAYRYSLYDPTRGVPGLTVSKKGAEVARIECGNNGRGATASFSIASPFIADHGTGGLMKFEEFWGEK